uniref:receptor protein-tyrosine kinase n=1 Tax=Geotrypetes seraphini TaxID=260995 RepID=A0A6P8QTY9_GEOSA|nr:vascular endothelial growth factor receptor kdr-like isoform X2 [Geotrypetes seraphini]
MIPARALGVLLLLRLPWVQGSLPQKTLTKPELSPPDEQIVKEAGQSFSITCRGSASLTWLWNNILYSVNNSLLVSESRCSEADGTICSQLTITKALASHTGYVSCGYSNLPFHKDLTAELYLFVKDNANPFVMKNVDTPAVINMTSEDELIIPCRVTSPDFNVTLKMSPDSEYSPPGMVWDPRKGFIIPSPSYHLQRVLKCVTHVNGEDHVSFHVPQKLVIPRILKVIASQDRVVVGDSLNITCLLQTTFNGRPNVELMHNGKNRSAPYIKKRMLLEGPLYTYFTTLVIPNVTMEDRGVYSCKDLSQKLQEKSIAITVYRNGVLKILSNRSLIYEVNEGHKRLKMTVKVAALPHADVTWYKDGELIGPMHCCYKSDPDKYRLYIKKVTEKDAGNYILVLRNPRHGLYENVTFTLEVNTKPTIYEKEIDFDKIEPILVGSEQTLQCTTSGKPPPTIHWEWQPCFTTLSSTVCHIESPEHRIPVALSNKSDLVGTNRILSIEEVVTVHEGKIKVLGILKAIAGTNGSGIFFCVPQNKVGRAERSIRFYVSDMHTGVSTIENIHVLTGSDVNLTCKAENYLYDKLTWYYPSSEEAPAALTVSEKKGHALSLSLTLTNVSLADAGLYRCKAKNRNNPREMIDRFTNVAVQEKRAPYIVQELEEVEVNSSNTLHLECLVDGVPIPTITWLKNGYEMKPASGISLLVNNSLIIERVKKDDEGLYECKASNEMGEARTGAFITIQASEEKANIEVIILVCTGVAATLFWLLLTLFIRKLKKPTATDIKTSYLSIIMDPDEIPLDEQCERLPYDSSKWEFPRDRLRLGKTLGHGAFGKVVEASAFGIDKCSTCKTVAVKMLKECATTNECKALMSELKILIHIGHHLNVVNLLGACTKTGGPLMVIVEYCKFGNLSNYLRSKRGDFIACKSQENSDPTEKVLDDSNNDLTELIKPRLQSVASTGSSASSGFIEDKSYSDSEEEGEDAEELRKRPLTMEDLICYSFQVAKGMEFLASRKCIHRDLAARNILLSENNVVKICDFGLARDIYKDPDYVRKGDARLPLKWMAPEAIFDKTYTTQSDVWSFGVLLWEIFSLGASPYPGVHIDEDFCLRLKEGTRMRPPEYTTPEMYQTMLDCWHGVPTERPNFTDLVERLGDLLQANVQQEGKDYIPLNTALSPDGDANSTQGGTEESLKNSIVRWSRWSLLEIGNKIKMRPLSVKTFDEVPVGKEEALHEESESDSGMVLSSEEMKSLKRQETRSWPFGIMAFKNPVNQFKAPPIIPASESTASSVSWFTSSKASQHPGVSNTIQRSAVDCFATSQFYSGQPSRTCFFSQEGV